jgi:hypothetical protein
MFQSRIIRWSFVVLVMLLLSMNAGAQPQFLWANRIGGSGVERGFAVTADDEGSCYVTGRFQNNCSFGTTNLISQGGNDIYLAKYDSAGATVWVKQFGGTYVNEGGGLGISFANGQLGLSGIFGGTGHFGGTDLISTGAEDVFHLRLDKNGTVLWARKGGGSGHDEARGGPIDAQGNSFFTGWYASSATFGTNVLTGTDNIFIVKYDSAGNELWARQAGGPYADEGRGIAVDLSGNCYVTGEFETNATFGATNLVGDGEMEMFLAKYDPAGNLVWATAGGGTGTQSGFGIGVDKQTNIFVYGSFAGNGKWAATNLTAYGNSDVFLAKYTQDGNLIWVKQIGGTGSESSARISIDFADNILITGVFNNTVDFGGTNMTAIGGDSDVFIAKYDSNGKLKWVRQGSSNGVAEGHGTAVNSAGEVFVCGQYSATLNFGALTLTNSNDDAFVVKLAADPPALNIVDAVGSAAVSWATNYVGFMLQASTNLNSSTNWLDSTDTPAIANGQFTVTNALSGNGKFYRLKK